MLAGQKQNLQVQVRKKRAKSSAQNPSKKAKGGEKIKVQKMVEISGEGGQKNWKLEAGGGGAKTSRFSA